MPESFVPEPVTGRDTIAWGLTDGVARYHDKASMRRDIDRISVEGDVAAVEQCMHGGHTTAPFHNFYVWIYEFRGDLIHRMTEHADTLLAHQAFAGAPKAVAGKNYCNDAYLPLALGGG
jgi:ketosteroid isomerase-like protein